mmetsp:Transcript_13434/g.25904  ORF Transcript_13434/g.25904 Transcript_13434/m.25904 type:complete len:488 (+) Transcript_13434:438-1901(+)|eukprot:CAMPEP_0171503734 /NCGR_PEP_ID=MMETSP0958-20121227/11094_1 /TAXON_ID=87120 /ORGANISM="Aurantiochytrium limacinum, Strain ATCCMYA-1381" /LENGTH=487 /DNA_ID=CAMNT_0012039325 /DNA_START=436 /DNA_END=1899 /DNA_ORIENTATION=+
MPKKHVNAAVRFPVFAISDGPLRLSPGNEGGELALLNVGGGGSARSGVGNFITAFSLSHNDAGDPTVRQEIAFNTGSRLCTSVDVSPDQKLVASSLEGGCLMLRFDAEAKVLREVDFFETDEPLDESTPACQNVARFNPADAKMLATAGDDTTASIWHVQLEEMPATQSTTNAAGDSSPSSAKVEEKGIEIKKSKDGEDSEKEATVEDDDQLTQPPTPKPAEASATPEDSDTSTKEKLPAAESTELAKDEEEAGPRFQLVAERKFHLVGHTKGVKDLHFSPSGKYLMTASGDNTCRIWNVASGKVLQIIPSDTAAGMVFRRSRFLTDNRLVTLQAKPGRGGHSFLVEFVRDPEAPEGKQWTLNRSVRVLKGLATTMHLCPPVISVADAAGGLTLHDYDTLRNLGHFDDVHSLPVTGLSAMACPDPSGKTNVAYVITGSMDKTMAMIPAKVQPGWGLTLGVLLPLLLILVVIFLRFALFAADSDAHEL